MEQDTTTFAKFDISRARRRCIHCNKSNPPQSHRCLWCRKRMPALTGAK